MIHRRPNLKTGSSFFLILMMTLVSVFSFCIKDASAEHKAVGVNFDKLKVSVERTEDHYGNPINVVNVDYIIRRGDWNQLLDLDIRPKLTIATKKKHRIRSFLVSRRKGHFTFRTSKRIRKKLHVRISGKSYYAVIDENGYNGQCQPWLKIKVRRFNNSHHDDHGDHYAMMKSCEKRGLTKSRCSRLIAKIGIRRAPAILEACAANTKWGSDFESCSRNAAKVRRGAAKTVYACAGASDGWNSNLVSCLNTAAIARKKPAKMVKACDAATKWFSDFTGCMKSAKQVRDAARVIASCDRATKWASDLKSCIRATKGLDDPASVVRMCAQTTDWASELKTCVKNGGPYVEYRRHEKHESHRTHRRYQRVSYAY